LNYLFQGKDQQKRKHADEEIEGINSTKVSRVGQFLKSYYK